VNESKQSKHDPVHVLEKKRFIWKIIWK